MLIIFSPSYQLIIVQVDILEGSAWVVPLMDHQSEAEAFWILIIISVVTSSLMCVCEVHLSLSSLLVISFIVSRSQPNNLMNQTLPHTTDSHTTDWQLQQDWELLDTLWKQGPAPLYYRLYNDNIANLDFPVLTEIHDAVFMFSSCSGRLEEQGSHVTQCISIFLHCMTIHSTVRHPLTLAQYFIQMMNYFPDFTNFYYDGWDKRNRKDDDVVVVLQWCSSCVFDACLHYLQKDVLV